MSDLIVVDDSCRSCGVAIPGGDDYCRHCGVAIVAVAPPAGEPELLDGRRELAVVPDPWSTAASRSTVASRSTWAPPQRQSLDTVVLESRMAVIAILLCAGPIGLPALWFSPRFSRRSKIITTTGFFLFTAVLPLAIAWYFLDFALRPIVDSLSQMAG